jgi:glycerophosphoryl diester phosphodiesterase
MQKNTMMRMVEVNDPVLDDHGTRACGRTPHPDSQVRLANGRALTLKVHRCLWSGDHPENSLAAVEECFHAGVARAEIDLHLLQDADFLVTHDADLSVHTTGAGLVRHTTRREAQRLAFCCGGRVTDHRPPLLSEVTAAIAELPAGTVLELDVKDAQPWPWARVEELARLAAPVKDRIIFGGCPDWNLRRLLQVDPTLPVSFNPAYYLDWPEPGPRTEPLPGVRGAYGYLDAHPLAQQRLGATADYLRDRLSSFAGLTPGARELHLRLTAFEHMLDDGLHDATALLHRSGLLLDVWTLNAGTPNWRRRLLRAAAGADLITTNTPHALAEALREATTAAA